MGISEDENNETPVIEQMVLDVDDKKLKGYGVRHQQCLVLFFCLTTAYAMRTCMGVALVAMTSNIDINLNQSLNNEMCFIPTKLRINKFSQIVYNDTSSKNDSLQIEATTLNNNVDDFEENTELYDRLQSTVDVIIRYNNTSSFKEETESYGLLTKMMIIGPYPRCAWSKKTQDMILSSFQWGYMLLQIPAGQLAHRFGSRMLLTGALTINFVVSFCIPWAAFYGGWILVVICRILQGLSQACIMPGMHNLFGKWAPLEERARLAGFAMGGAALGAVLGLPITGFLAASSLGWPGIFRFYGLLSGFVAIIVWIVIADSPDQHRKISESEKRYIEEGIGQKAQGGKHIPVPWSRILRSRAVLAIVVAHIGQSWGQITLYSEIPAFMNKVMKVNIKANGMLTALPFLVMWFANFFFSWFTDMLIVKKIFSVTNARKVANSLGYVPAAIGLVILAYAPKNIYVVETLLVIVCAFKISAQVGFQVSNIDISPNFAGTLMSISNFVSNMIGSTAPLVAGFILTDDTDEYLWRKVFLVAAGLYFFTNLFYVIFGTSEKADWNEPDKEHIQRDEEAREEKELMMKSENGKYEKLNE